MKTLHVDIETFSSVDLKKCGVSRYAESPDFEVLLFGYALDGGAPAVVDLTAGEAIPADILSALFDYGVLKKAFNANFERACLEAHFGAPLLPEQWECVSVHALYLGLPPSLDGVCDVIKVPEQYRKKKSGYALIRTFCLPCKPTAKNGMRTRNLPEHAPESWQTFKEYCLFDVLAERYVSQKLARHPVPKKEKRLWDVDQWMVSRGVRVDIDLVDSAIFCAEQVKASLTEEACRLTRISNPNSVKQLTEWLSNELDEDIQTLTKKDVPKILERTDDETVSRVLRLRQELSKSSVAKYQAMRRSVCSDDRLRGVTQFYGANRTGRMCLAEGTPVLVKTAEGKILDKPIEEVLVLDQVWDGDAWVHHEGVVYSGDKEVITWDGVTATPDHEVWVSPLEKMPLGEAMAKGIRLWEGGHVFDL